MADQELFKDNTPLSESWAESRVDLLDISELQRELGRYKVMNQTAQAQYEALYIRNKATTEKLQKLKTRASLLESEKDQLTRKQAELEAGIAEAASKVVQESPDLDRLRNIAAYLRINSDRAISILPTSVQNLNEIQSLLLQCSEQIGKESELSGLAQAARILVHRIQSEAENLKKLLTLFRSSP